MVPPTSNITIRKATPEDAGALAELANFAGEGGPLYLWERMAEKGTNAWEVGRRRVRREEGDFSYRNAIVAEVEGKVAACLIGYQIPLEPGGIDYETMPAMFVPLQELENLNPGSWYTDILGAYPHTRGQGIGTRLLAVAENKARKSGCAGFAIIVSDANTRARRLYEQLGYSKRASREMIKEDWENPGRNWVLLVKQITLP